MEVIQYKDNDGVWHLEIKSRHLASLKDLQNEHEKLGRKCMMTPFNDCCEAYWVLDVQMNVAVAA